MNNTTITAKDIMSTKPFALSPEMDVFEVIDALLRHKISGAPVVDKHLEFMGIFSEDCCMRFITNAAYEKLPDATLMHFVNRDPPTIQPDTDLLDICEIFLDQTIRRLPVLEDGKLLGIVSRRDVMHKVSELTRDKPCGHRELLYLSAYAEHLDVVTGRIG